MTQEISLAISVGCFGLVAGFLSGYSLRAYLSFLHRKSRKYHANIVAAACLLVMSQTAQATSISVSAEAPGVLLPSLSSATVLTFADLPVGSLPSYQFSGGALSGSGAEEDTSVGGKFARPAGDATGFLTVSYPSAVGAVNLVLTQPKNYFGLYWGSMDPYNSIAFLENNGLIATYSGTNVANLTGLVANGQQQSAASNRYIEFRFDAGFYDEVILGTTGYGFEVDNIAFGDPPLPISEPGTLLVLCSSLYGLALARRRGCYPQLRWIAGAVEVLGSGAKCRERATNLVNVAGELRSTDAQMARNMPQDKIVRELTSIC
jgi:hypothetical protein